MSSPSASSDLAGIFGAQLYVTASAVTLATCVYLGYCQRDRRRSRKERMPPQQAGGPAAAMDRRLCPPEDSLESLPADVLAESLLPLLPPRELARLARTCSTFNAAVQDGGLWERVAAGAVPPPVMRWLQDGHNLPAGCCYRCVINPCPPTPGCSHRANWRGASARAIRFKMHHQRPDGALTQPAGAATFFILHRCRVA